MKKIVSLIIQFLSSIFKKKENGTTDVQNEAETVIVPIEEEIGKTEIIEEKKYKDMVILLDNGHASTTPGKRSPVLPDGRQLFEYEFNRDVVRRIAEKLDAIGIQYRILVPEENKDISLSKRAERANMCCAEFGVDKCLFISIHANAGSNGEWQNGRGWSIYTTKGETKSDKYATIFYEEAESLLPPHGMTVRKDMRDGDPDYEENFTVIYCTKCPAVLTENLFMDNKKDVEFLLSDEGRDVIAQIHVNAIKRICAD